MYVKVLKVGIRITARRVSCVFVHFVIICVPVKKLISIKYYVTKSSKTLFIFFALK